MIFVHLILLWMSEHSAFFIMVCSNLLPFHLICKVFCVTLFARHLRLKILAVLDLASCISSFPDIIYHWKCPANNCTAEYIGETNRSLKERVSDHRNQTTSAIRNQHISIKHPKAELKDFTIIDRESNTLHHRAKEALHIHIKDPSLNRNIGKVRIPSVFNKLLKPPRQPELPHSSIPTPKGGTFFSWSFNTKDN